MNIIKTIFEFLICMLAGLGTLVIISYFTCLDDYRSKMECYSEYCYFEGQKDCLEGDIRVEHVSDSTYIWIKSPYDNDKIQLYNPRLSMSDNFKLIN